MLTPTPPPASEERLDENASVLTLRPELPIATRALAVGLFVFGLDITRLSEQQRRELNTRRALGHMMTENGRRWIALKNLASDVRSGAHEAWREVRKLDHPRLPGVLGSVTTYLGLLNHESGFVIDRAQAEAAEAAVAEVGIATEETAA